MRRSGLGDWLTFGVFFMLMGLYMVITDTELSAYADAFSVPSWTGWPFFLVGLAWVTLCIQSIRRSRGKNALPESSGEEKETPPCASEKTLMQKILRNEDIRTGLISFALCILLFIGALFIEHSRYIYLGVVFLLLWGGSNIAQGIIDIL